MIYCMIVVMLDVTLFMGDHKPVELSLQESIQRAIANNLDLKVERYNPRIAKRDITIQDSKFDPVFSFNFGYDNFEKEKFDKTSSSDGFDVDVNAKLYKKYFSGTTTSLQYSNGYDRYYDSNDIIGFEGTNTFWSQELSFKVTQPLLRNFGVAVNTTDLVIAERNNRIREYELQQKILEVITEMRFLYLDLITARESVKFQELSLQFARNFLEMTEQSIEEGMMAPASLVEARRIVADRQQELIGAEKKFLLVGNKIKKFITPLDRNFYSEVVLLPMDALNFTDLNVDFSMKITNALKYRRDLFSGRLSLENAETLVNFYRNQLLPKLDVSASVGVQGLNEEWSQSYDSVSQGDFFTWKFEVAFEIPLGNRLAKSKYEQSQLKERQTREKLNKIQNQIMYDVQQSIVTLRAEALRVKAVRQNRELAEQQLRNQQIKYEEGLIPLFQLQDTEQKLTKARINEVKAIADHEKAIAALDFAEGNIRKVMEQFFIRIDNEEFSQ
ncbi:TolC family protein [Candidatus Uabimicrobium amorphum]|uniref:RND transporter n=1 Tax=Uabimicrobium amorphum TaxID=2596890 RepID=A0A5S9IKE2_UABAM|nr:TolC family protein [Candidatus Uabimicrobium amorphum]BBM83489.1 RND transporter [Candidatus Uabimicrobium amorphum]